MRKFLTRAFLVLISIPLACAVCQAQTSAVSSTIGKLKDKRPAVRIAAAKTLGLSRDAAAVEPLIAVVVDEDEDVRVRVEAARSLGMIKDPRALQPFIDQLEVSDADVVEGIKEAFKMMGPMSIPPLIEALGGDAGFVAGDILTFIGGPAFDALVASLKSDNSLRRKNACSALGYMNDPRAVEPLILTLKDPDSEVRTASAEALQALGDDRAIEPLILTLKDTDPLVRGAAATSLGNLNAIDAVDDLIVLLKDEDNKKDAALALGNIASPRAIEVLMTAAKNHDLEVIAGAYEFFVKRNTPAIIPALIDTLNEYGDTSIAEAFLASGNSQLATAAREWAKEMGYEIVANPGSGKSKRRRRR